MYNPSSLREQRPELLLQLTQDFPFATLITVEDGDLQISHVPVVVERSGGSGAPFTVSGHLARANAHCKALARGCPSVVIFQGPHGYVSPSWYENQPSVPTWNYVVVHMHGRPQTLDSSGTNLVLRKLIEKFESARNEPWVGDLPDDFLHEELAAIVGFEIAVERVDGKFKLGQTKSEADRAGTLIGLEREGDLRGQELARFTRAFYAQGR